MIALERGFVLNSMILAAMVVFIIEKQFITAALWSLGAALLSFTGIIHAFKITDTGIVSMLGLNAAPHFSIGYGVMAIAFFLAGYVQESDFKGDR